MPKKAGKAAALLPAEWLVELSPASLEDVASATVFGRGLAYFTDGRCELIRDAGTATTWQVRGSSDYEVELYFEDPGLHANCTCPHARDGAFCKHVVSAGLAWAELLGMDVTVEAGPKAKAVAQRAAAAAAKHNELRQFLEARPGAELAGRLLHWAGRDREMLADLRAWKASSEVAAQPHAWKPAIAEILKKTRDFYDWRESSRYAQRAEAVVPLLRDVLAADPVTARDACVATLRRLFKIGEDADDSDGAIGGVLHAVHDVLLDALAAHPPQGIEAGKWLETWLKLQDEDPWGLWDDDGMLEAAGPEVGARYFEQVARDWRRWLAGRKESQARASGSKGGALHDGNGWNAERARIRQRYLSALEARGDIAGQIEAMAADLEGAHEYVALAQALEAAGRPRDALAWLESAYKLHARDSRLQDALLGAYERDGCVDEALAIRRTQLEAHPSAAHYLAVLAAAAAAGRDVQRDRSELHDWAARHHEGARVGWRGRGSALGLGGGVVSRNVSVRAAWLMAEGRHTDALALARAQDAGVDEGIWLALARRLGGADAPVADLVFQSLLAHRMRSAQSPYREELDLVREWLSAVPPATARERWVSLKSDFRAKRNFVAGLEVMKPHE